MNLEHSKTLQCLVNAFAGESQARNKYTFFSKIAKKEGYEQISAIFLDTADNEKEHAKLFYKYIPKDKHFQVNGSYPFAYGDTYENLVASANHEREEWESVYKDASLIAKEEGFDDISKLFSNIVEIEKRHAHRYDTLAQLLKEEKLFKKEELTQWVCRKCGHTSISKEAPCECPVCGHPQEYFEVFCEQF